ncbi:MAG: SpoIID/LytB domain-containing protein [Bacillota bacterium]|nr:SpoIID/LytB domain-containing protein [Bacillota bacterium]
MKVKVVNNRFYFIVAGLLILLFILLFLLLLPRTVENAVLIGTNNGTSTFFIGDKQKKFKTGSLNLEKFSVVNFKYNAFKVYGFTEAKAIQERVMLKKGDSYELEVSGDQKLAAKAWYYSIDKNNSISLSSNSKLIVGKNNVRLYKNKKGLLSTVIMTPMDYSTLRVAISTNGFESVYHDKIEIKAQSPLKVYSKTEDYSSEVPEKAVLTFEYSDGKTRLSINNLSKDFSKRLYIEGSFIAVSSLKRLDNKTMTPVYSGVMEITPQDKGLLMINEVGLEDYLTRVVPSEMPSTSSPEALKAQAVAARTYALSDMLANRFAASGYHVDDSTKSQVYNNIYAQPSTNEAVKATKGMIMTYNGLPIDAKYYSTSAGTGAAYGDIFMNADGTSDNEPYLQFASYLEENTPLPEGEEQWLEFYKNKNIPALDSDSQYFRWKATCPSDILTKVLQKSLKELYDSETRKGYITINAGGKTVKSFPELGTLQDIKVLKRGKAGNIIRLSYKFENAEVELLGDSSIRYSIKLSKEYAGTPVTLVMSKGKSSANFSSIPSSFFSFEKQDSNFVLYGGGYGHGVGMSQSAAMSMGKKGVDFETILNTFYKDIKIEQIY